MAYLILADGSVFQGQSIGAKGEAIGETVFTTGMTGYNETLTDPSYYGQIVAQTFPLIGNYGVISEDFESEKSWVRGYVVHELCDKMSNFRAEQSLDSFLKAQKIVGIAGIDTRCLTKKLRDSGVMNGMITSSSQCPAVTPHLLEKIKSYKIEDAVKSVSYNDKSVSYNDKSVTTDDDNVIKPRQTTGRYIKPQQTGHQADFRVVLWDFGAKKNIQRELEKRGCEIIIVPYSVTAEKILSFYPDGVMLSNGPGDPADNISVIQEIKKLCEAKIPIFGICLGHQMLAIAKGAVTSKLKYGHRGGNHPVKQLESGRVYISSQNHGYAVENQSIPQGARLSFVNANDGSCEGIDYNDIPAFSVQFHPEACGGPHDTNFLFDKFIKMMDKGLTFYAIESKHP